MTADVRGNFRRIYLYKLLGEFYLIVPVLIPYYQANGLPATRVFLIQAAYTLSILLFEVPSGYLADVVGRRKTLILGAVLMPLGLTVYALGRSLAVFILAECILAAGNSMRSGSDSALLYDSLLQIGRAEEYKRYEGRSFFFTRLGTSSAAILGGLLAVLAIRLPFYVNISTTALMFPLAVSLAEPERKKLAAASPLRGILRISRWSLTEPRLRVFILYAALVGSTGITGIWAAFLYYGSLGIGVGWFGALFALFQLASAFGSSRAHSVEKKLGFDRFLFLLPAGGVCFLLVGAIKSPIMIPFILGNALLWGLSFPVFMGAINRLVPSETRATVLSLTNMASSLSFVVLSPLFGRVAERLSLSAAYIVLGAYSLVYAALCLRSWRKIRAGGSGNLPEPPVPPGGAVT